MFFIIDENEEHDKEMIEANRYAMMAAITSVFEGKDIKLFDKSSIDGYEVVDEETYNEEKQDLLEKYKSIGGDI